ncbi:MAG: tRNA threonylcarbamoyl adenosine modification protein YeaZ [Bradymonadia bacterium]|jgi:tRNA threonylcarbamoyl adenosine modification protein YeaZ
MNDLTLYIETTPRFSEVALACAEWTEVFQAEERTGSRDLAALVRRAFQTRDVKPSDLSGIAIDIGPGALSSVRVGVAFANALAYGLGVETRGYASLDVMGHAAGNAANTQTISVVRGPDSAVYAGCWGGEHQGKHWVVSKDEAADHFIGQALRNGAILAGPATETVREWLGDVPFDEAVAHSSAARLIAIDRSENRVTGVPSQNPIVGENFR